MVSEPYFVLISDSENVHVGSPVSLLSMVPVVSFLRNQFNFVKTAVTLTYKVKLGL